AIFKENRIVGRGRATEAAARRIAAGIPWREAGAKPGDAGNGSAMRAAPIGLLCADLEQVFVIADEQSLITHTDPPCRAGSIAVAACTWMASRDCVDIPQLASLVARSDEDFGAKVARLDEWRQLSPDDAVPEILRASGGADPRWHQISPFVVPSVLWSL